MAERVLLNFLQFLSGVATETLKYVDALGVTSTRVLDTRKTTPGYRMLQKYAVACGGGWNHRLGLFDRVMLKDNHLAADGSQAGEPLTGLVKRAREQNPDMLIEVEVDNLEQVPAVLAAAPDKLMLDNFRTPDLQTAVDLIGDRACTEATGSITLTTLPEMGPLGLDFVSTGALVHKSVWKDIGLDWS
jgi:nicotinate-nucleotide pyrophosphorylase (carboxylating)